MNHLDQLIETFADTDKFTAAFEALKADTSMNAKAVIGIAKEFGGRRTTSRAAALKSIWNRHAALMGFKAKVQHMNGRSAA